MRHRENARPVSVGRSGHASVRQRPEQTRLHRLVGEHYRAFAALREVEGRPLPTYVRSAVFVLFAARGESLQREGFHALMLQGKLLRWN